jgi:DHA2 family multidrug resistance protein
MTEPPLRRGLISVSVMLATIIQTLDMTIANVALPNMQGSLSATQDQISWVLTSYVVAAAIMTPPTGYLAARLGRKRLFMMAVAGFTVASLLCGLATSLGQMVTFRLLQGMFGASLIPLSQAVLLDVYPREQHGKAMAMWGVGVMVGPVLGPTLGGYLTEFYNWRWVFLINLPIGALAWLGVLAFVPETKRQEIRFDAFGFALLSIAIGSLQMMLDRGEHLGWFDSPEILIEAGLTVVCLYMFVVHMLTADKPFLTPAVFTDRNFVTGLFFIFVVGIILLATMALMPPFLQHLMGYPVAATGMVLAPRGVGTMVSMLLIGRLVSRFDPRLLLLIGFGLISFSLWEMSRFTMDVSRFTIVWTGFVQGLGLGFVFVPMSTIAFGTLPVEHRTEAAGMYSLMRNLGSSIGVSIVVSLLARNTQINHAQLATHISPYNPLLQNRLADGVALTDPALLARLNEEVTRQAALISYLNDFYLMMFITLAVIPLLLLLRPPPRAAAAA